MSNQTTDNQKLASTYNYLGASLALARAIHQNARDTETARERKQLCYFVDVNIVRWYLDPRQNFHLVSPLTHPEEPERTDSVDFASSVIAAEYIFSDRLIGADSLPPFLTPFHADELLESLERDIKKVKHMPLDAIASPELRGSADALVTATDKFKQDQSPEVLGSLFSAFELLLQGAYGRLAFSEARISSLFGKNRVVRSSEFGDFGLDGSYRSESDVKRWENLLIDSGKMREGTNKIERDAQSLCLLQKLNYDAARDNRPVCFLMISADMAMHEAVDLWREKEFLHGIDRFDFMRHPRQYVPIINLNNMRSDFEQKIPGFAQLMQSVDDISFSVRRDLGVNELNFLNSISHSPDRISRKLRGHVKDTRLLDYPDVSERWRKALEASVLMNAQFVLGATDSYVMSRIKPLADETVDEVLRKRVTQHIEDIANLHIEIAAKSVLKAQVKSLHRFVSGRRAMRPARSDSLARLELPALLSRMVRISGEAGPNDLAAFIDDFIILPETQVITEFDIAVEQSSGVDAAKIACLLTFRLGVWDQAQYFADRLVRSGIPSAEREEFRFIGVVAGRFIDSSVEALQKNKRMLETQVSRYGRDSDIYGLARTLAEIGAQNLFFAYSQILLVPEDRRAPDTYIWRAVAEAEVVLQRAARTFRWTGGPKGQSYGVSTKQRDALRAQILANMMSAFLFTELRRSSRRQTRISGEIPQFVLQTISEILEARQQELRFFDHGEFYALCARKRLFGGRYDASDRARVKSLLGLFYKDAKFFEEIDRREVQWLRQELNL